MTKRKRTAGSGRRHSRRANWGLRLLGGGALVVAAVLGWAVLARRFAPQGDAGAGRVDVLVVLGTPTNEDGDPSAAMLDRVNEAVAEYERGASSRILFTGGAAHNRFVEADAMARAAEADGVPQAAIYRERAAQNTMQNLRYSLAVAQANGWRSMEVISSPAHLPRVQRMLAVLDRNGIRWRVHAAPEIDTPGYYRELAPAVEVLKMAHFLLWPQ